MAHDDDPAYIHALAGSIGGCIATVITYPLMAKSARAANARRRARQSTSPSSTSTSSFRSMSDAYTGLSASLVGTTVSQGVYFYFYSLLRSFFIHRRRGETHGHAPSVFESLGIASLAGMANVLITNPIWVVATRLQTLSGENPNGSDRGSENEPTDDSDGTKNKKKNKKKNKTSSVSNLSVLKSVYADYGIPGFWNGCGASLIMVINPTIQYAIYEWLMARTLRERRRQQPSTLHVFLCSSVAKAGATLCTYPMLTIKTRMMSARRDDQYSSVLDAVKSIQEREGLAGYYQGIETKILQSILGASVLLMIKEKITASVRGGLLRR